VTCAFNWGDLRRALLCDREGVDVLHRRALYGLGVSIEQLLLELRNGRPNIAVVVRPLVFCGRAVPFRYRMVIVDNLANIGRLCRECSIVQGDLFIPTCLLGRWFVMVHGHDDWERFTLAKREAR